MCISLLFSNFPHVADSPSRIWLVQYVENKFFTYILSFKLSFWFINEIFFGVGLNLLIFCFISLKSEDNHRGRLCVPLGGGGGSSWGGSLLRGGSRESKTEDRGTGTTGRLKLLDLFPGVLIDKSGRGHAQRPYSIQPPFGLWWWPARKKHPQDRALFLWTTTTYPLYIHCVCISPDVVVAAQDIAAQPNFINISRPFSPSLSLPPKKLFNFYLLPLFCAFHVLLFP